MEAGQPVAVRAPVLGDPVLAAGTPGLDGPVLPPGAPGKTGGLYLEFVPRAGRTRLAATRRRVPLHVGRVHHPQSAWPELAQLMITMPTGGMVQGDEIALQVVARSGARVHLTSQSATRAYRCPAAPIRQRIVLTVEENALLEWWPDPLLPYAGSNVSQQLELEVHPRGVLLVADCWLAGRLARGEMHAYSSLRLDARARRPDGTLLFRDSVRLAAAERDLRGPGQLGDARAMGTFFLLAPGSLASLERSLAAALDEALPGRAGATRVPNDAGLLVRLLTPRPDELRHGQRLVFALARRHLFGQGPGESPKL